ncbi:hypothetical protein [Coralloluteibacterium thermophilus]|uniref:Uncharacterized protein n=1 Tax=Coralloluteibacterium thermophilum TaxID=2707049 RepID=A0ABV9NFK8_9GAMM
MSDVIAFPGRPQAEATAAQCTGTALAVDAYMSVKDGEKSIDEAASWLVEAHEEDAADYSPQEAREELEAMFASLLGLAAN